MLRAPLWAAAVNRLVAAGGAPAWDVGLAIIRFLRNGEPRMHETLRTSSDHRNGEGHSGRRTHISSRGVPSAFASIYRILLRQPETLVHPRVRAAPRVNAVAQREKQKTAHLSPDTINA